MGLSAPAFAADPELVEIDILSINDLHGRIEADRQSAGGAVLSCAVQQFRDANDNTLFVSGGDNVGASTFTSFVADDQPTLDVLNEIELDVSTLGNHEFDQGRTDVDGRLTDEANFPWLSANIYDTGTNQRAYDAYYIEEFEGVRVGVIGGMTEELGSLVSPSGISDLEVRDLADEINDVADDLTDGDEDNGEADVLVVVIHDGAPGADMASAAGTPYGKLLDDANENIVAIISGHTHQAYIAEPKTGLWATQTGQYGENLGHLSLTYDTANNEVTASEAVNVDLVRPDGDPLCTGDPDVQAIVDAAKDEADVLGAEPVGEITGDINRAQQTDGSENRGGESTLGNAVADVQLWAAQRTAPDAQIAFMNPGGLREDLTYAESAGEGDGVVTYKEAAVVQPFANTLMTTDLTGEQIIGVLEEQWQPSTSSRPFLKLGISERLSYTYDPEADAENHIQEVWLDDQPLDITATYTVVANSFLASGGDNFSTLAQGTNTSDTGQSDLNAMVDYFDQVGSLSPDHAKRSMGLHWVSEPDKDYQVGNKIALDLSSLAFSAGEPTPEVLNMTLDGIALPNVTVDASIVDKTSEAGRAKVRITVPSSLTTAETVDLTIEEDGTDFSLTFPIQIVEPSEFVDIDVLSINDLHGRIEADRQTAGGAVLSCAVDEFRDDNDNTVFVSAGDNIGASTFTSFVANDQPTLDVLNAIGLDHSALGNHEFDQGQDDVNDRIIPAADFSYLAANIFKDGEHAYEPYAIQEIGGIQVGFIGGLTTEMDSLVSPDGVVGLEFRDLSTEINKVAEQLTDGDDSNGEAEVLIVLVHDGAATPDMSGIDGTGFGDLVQNADDNIAAIISGHTHQAYVNDVDGMWVTSTGSYGENLGHLNLTIERDSGKVTASDAELVDLVSDDGDPICAGDPAVQAIVDAATAEAEVLGAEPVGEITADINRAQQTDGSENRGGESTLGNAVADVQLWAAQRTAPDAQIAFMNPGGLRADLIYEESAGEGDGVVTYEEAALVQPFANTLVTTELSGAQVIQVLEEQWQPADASRPFLKLGVSEGLTYTYDPEAEAGERIQSALLNGAELDPAAMYTVVANSFLAAGGDNFRTLAEGTGTADSGQSDLTAMVDYFAEVGSLSPDYVQRAVGAHWVSDEDGVYEAGDEVAIDLSSLLFSSGEPTPDFLTLTLGGIDLPDAAVDASIVDTTDEVGRAEIRFAISQEMLDAAEEAGQTSLDLVITDPVNGLEIVLPVQVGVESGPGGELPETGADVSGLVALSVLLLAAGTGLTLRKRHAVRN